MWIEHMTYALQKHCSTNWAKEALVEEITPFQIAMSPMWIEHMTYPLQRDCSTNWAKEASGKDNTFPDSYDGGRIRTCEGIARRISNPFS